MKRQPYIFQEGQLIATKYRGYIEYSLTCLDNKRKNPQQIIIIGGGPNASDRLFEWSKLGGRWIYEVACSNPSPPISAPSEILHITKLGKPDASIVKREAFPTKCLDFWNSYSEEDIYNLVTNYVKQNVYDVLHPISKPWFEKKTAEMSQYCDFVKSVYSKTSVKEIIKLYTQIVFDTPLGENYMSKILALKK